MPSPLCSVIYLEVLRPARRDVMGLLGAFAEPSLASRALWGPSSPLLIDNTSAVFWSGIRRYGVVAFLPTFFWLYEVAIKVLPQIAFPPCAVAGRRIAAVDRKQMLTGDQLAALRMYVSARPSQVELPLPGIALRRPGLGSFITSHLPRSMTRMHRSQAEERAPVPVGFVVRMILSLAMR